MNTDRDAAMVRLFESGNTIREIAGIHSLSYQRVCQILSSHGKHRVDGGGTVKAADREAARERAREARCLATFGHTRAEHRAFMALNAQARKDGATPKTCPYGAFLHQRHHAGDRKIPWKLTLAEWWAIWVASGKWHLRGLKRGCYVMSRVGDTGAYEVGNVFIQRTEDNVSEGRRLTHERRQLISAAL